MEGCKGAGGEGGQLGKTGGGRAWDVTTLWKGWRLSWRASSQHGGGGEQSAESAPIWEKRGGVGRLMSKQLYIYYKINRFMRTVRGVAGMGLCIDVYVSFISLWSTLLFFFFSMIFKLNLVVSFICYNLFIYGGGGIKLCSPKRKCLEKGLFLQTNSTEEKLKTLKPNICSISSNLQPKIRKFQFAAHANHSCHFVLETSSQQTSCFSSQHRLQTLVTSSASVELTLRVSSVNSKCWVSHLAGAACEQYIWQMTRA